MSLILEHVNYIYDSKQPSANAALHDIHLQINPGEKIAIIGHTGSGKSTLARLCNGLLVPSAGRVLYEGKDVHAKGYPRTKLCQSVGLVFQYPEHQLFESSVLADVCFGPKNLGYSGKEQTDMASKALQSVGIGEELYERSPHELSGGMRRRVALAGVLAMNPKIMILDEPTAGLDPNSRSSLLRLLEDLHSRQNMGICMISHSMEEVAALADRVIVLNKGQIIYDDTTRCVFSHEEELREIGLEIPHVTRILCRLKKEGLPVDQSLMSVRAAAKDIAQAYKRARTC